MIGRLVSLLKGKGEQFITLSVRADFSEEFDELKDADVDVEITKHLEKRSRNANAYMWVLCDKIADKIGSTKAEVYRQSIHDVGVWKDVYGLSEKDAATFRYAWENQGVGWLTEEVGTGVRFYYGSSAYNTKQMSRLIDNLVQDAQAVGIATETPDEIAKMISLWGEERKGK